MSYFKARMHQIRFRLVLRPDPARRAYRVPQPLYLDLRGPTSKGKGKVTTNNKDITVLFLILNCQVNVYVIVMLVWH